MPYPTIHGRRRTTEYFIWRNFRQRCTNPKDPCFKNYGGRGISVCDRWNKFENFFADMGERPPGLTLDRRNNDGDYDKGNCRWATRSEQNLNRRPSRRQRPFIPANCKTT
jgi:hypothetical protein